jgi:hypothetical protein
MMEKKEKVRKERSDKKRPINPIIPLELYDLLCRLSYICNRPLKSIGETLCEYGLFSHTVITTLSVKFHRDYRMYESVFCGNPNLQIGKEIIGPEQHQINLRFRKEYYEKICELAYALDMSKCRTTMHLLEAAVADYQVLGDLLALFVQEDIDSKRMQQLRLVLRYVNDPYHDEMTLSHLLGFLLEHMGEKAKRMTDTIVEWLESLRKEKQDKLKVAKKG